MTIVARFGRKLIGFDIAWDKSTERLQNLVDNSPRAKQYHSDGYISYREIIYWGKFHHHFDKSETYTVEGVNADLRQYIPFLKRRSRCFLRSLETAKAALKIFMSAFNRFAQAKLVFPKYKNYFCLTQFI